MNPNLPWNHRSGPESLEQIQESDMSLIFSLILGKLRDRTTYLVALIVGTLINLYGQLFVPWIRNVGDPFTVF
jgi:hypothetical protein